MFDLDGTVAIVTGAARGIGAACSRALAAAAVETFGGIDVLINNAAVFALVSIDRSEKTAHTFRAAAARPRHLGEHHMSSCRAADQPRLVVGHAAARSGRAGRTRPGTRGSGS